MLTKRKLDDDKSSRRKKKVTKTKTIIQKWKGKAKKNKVLPKVKCSVVAQMTSFEKEIVDEYNKNVEKEKKYNASLKDF